MSQFGRKEVTLRDGSEVVARDSPVIGIWNGVPFTVHTAQEICQN